MARRTRYELPVILLALGARIRCLTTAGVDVELDVDAVQRDEFPPGGLLTAIEVPGVAETWFDYERSLRPTMTVGTAVRRTAAGTRVRIAVGSEYQPVHAAELRLAEELSELDPQEVADALAAQLPNEVGDVLTTADYRRHATAVLLERGRGRP